MKDNQTRIRILEAAEEEFLLQGFAGARTTEIACRANISHTMLHYYFKTKEQLFDMVIDKKIQELIDILLVDELGGDGNGELPIEQRILGVMSRHFDFLRKNPAIPRFVINELIVRPHYMEKLKKRLSDSGMRVMLSWQQELDKAAEEGLIEKTDAINLFIDMCSLNVFAFIISPIILQAIPQFDYDAFFEHRKTENLEMIRRRLEKRKI